MVCSEVKIEELKEEIKRLRDKMVAKAKENDQGLLDREVQQISRELDEKIMEYSLITVKG